MTAKPTKRAASDIKLNRSVLISFTTVRSSAENRGRVWASTPGGAATWSATLWDQPRYR